MPARAAAVRQAREFVRRVLTEWDRVEQEEAGSLLVTELTANAVLHAEPPVVVTVVEVGEEVLLEVSDGSRALPVAAPRSTAAQNGRGLRLLQRYSADRGVALTPTGKMIWAVLAGDVVMPVDEDEAWQAWGDADLAADA